MRIRIVLVSSTSLGRVSHQDMLVVRRLLVLERAAPMASSSGGNTAIANIDGGPILSSSSRRVSTVEASLILLLVHMSDIFAVVSAHYPVGSALIKHLNLVELHITDVVGELAALVHNSLGLELLAGVNMVSLVHGTGHVTISIALKRVSQISIVDESLVLVGMILLAGNVPMRALVLTTSLVDTLRAEESNLANVSLTGVLLMSSGGSSALTSVVTLVVRRQSTIDVYSISFLLLGKLLEGRRVDRGLY